MRNKNIKYIFEREMKLLLLIIPSFILIIILILIDNNPYHTFLLGLCTGALIWQLASYLSWKYSKEFWMVKFIKKGKVE